MNGFRMTGRIVLTAALCAFLASGLSGCAKREIVVSKPIPVGAEFTPETGADLTIDFDQVHEDCEDLLDPNDYPLSEYIDSVCDEESKTITLIWPMKDEAEEKDAVEYAYKFIHAYNEAAMEQDYTIKPSTDTYFGGLFDRYAVNIQLFRNKDIMDPDKYLVSMTIPAGTNKEIVPWSEYDGVNFVEMPGGLEEYQSKKHSGESAAESSASN